MKIMFMLLLVAALSCCSGHPQSNDELKCRVMKVKGGYGYMVLHGKDTVIYQPFVPAVGGRRPFLKKKDALEVGKLVCRKFAAGQSPALSREDVKSCLTDTGVLHDRQ